MRIRIVMIACFLACLACTAVGQTSMSSSYSPNGQFSMTASFSASGFPIPAVVGAPYSAEQVGEHTQVLNDGTRISQPFRGTTRHYRDSAGRTRTERPLAFGHPGVAKPFPFEGPLLVEINDPVADYRLILDTVNLVAHRSMYSEPRQLNRTSPPIGYTGAVGAIGSGMIAGSTAAPGFRTAEQPSHIQAPGSTSEADLRPSNSSEPLGSQMIEGVLCEGTRLTTTYPIGSMGNDRPFVVTHESWRSPELQLVVLLKIDDPRGGASVNRYTNINRSEPDPMLFQIPAGYQVVDETGPFTIKISSPKP